MRGFRLLTVAILAVAATSGRAEDIYGVTTVTFDLVRFDSANPNAVTTIAPISGLTAGQTIRNIDFRPSDGQMYAISSDGAAAAQLYTVNLASGVATPIGTGLSLTGTTSDRVKIDFNPVSNVLRVVTGTTTGGGLSYRVNANTGTLIAQDTSLSPAATYGGIAYSNSVAGATSTTLFAYNFTDDLLVRVGSANGSPNSPNTGLTETIGPTVKSAFSSATVGFDISGTTGIGYVTMDEFNTTLANTELYTVDFANGTFTQVGTGEMPVELIDITVFIAPVPEPTGLVGLAAAGLWAARYKHRRQAVVTSSIA